MISTSNNSHHFAYAAAGLIAFVTVAYFFKPDHSVRPPVTIAPIAQPGTTVREIQALQHSFELLAAAKGAVPAFLAPSIHILPSSGFGAAAEAQLLHALGSPRTAPAIIVKLDAPTPAPVLTPPPDISKDDAAWHHIDVYNATAEAIANAKLNVTVTQEPIPPSRISAIYTSDSAVGISYALKRRGQLDLTLAAMKGPDGRLAPAAGYAYHIKGTSASVFAGFKLTKGRPGAAFGFGISY